MGKKNKDSLGRSLIKDRFSKNRHRKHVEDNTMVIILIFVSMYWKYINTQIYFVIYNDTILWN